MENNNNEYKFSLKSADIDLEKPSFELSTKNGAAYPLQNGAIYSNQHLLEGHNFALVGENEKSKNITSFLIFAPVTVSVDTSNEKANNAINFLNKMDRETKERIDRSFKKNEQYGINLRPLRMQINSESQAMSIATGKKEYTAQSVNDVVTDMNSIANVERLSLIITKDIAKDLEIFRQNKNNEAMQKALLDKVLIYKALKENGVDVDKGLSAKDVAGFKALVESADRYVERNKPVQNLTTDPTVKMNVAR